MSSPVMINNVRRRGGASAGRAGTVEGSFGGAATA